ncbi:MAG: DUF1801 domain-containing protein [Aestuariivirga sp.]
MQSQAASVADYLNELPEERREAIAKVRAVIRKNLPKGFVEQMSYGMIGYVVPHKLYPAGYHCDPKLPLCFAGLASQKQYMALYLMTVYQSTAMEQWLRQQFQARGKKLDMGKSCIRFKKLDDLPLDVIGEAIGRVSLADYIINYEDVLKLSKTRGKK